MKECITHHYACDCRESLFEKTKQELADKDLLISQLDQARLSLLEDNIKAHKLLRDVLKGYESKILKFEIYKNIRDYFKSVD